MGSLYETNDNHTQERANRVSIASRYALPLYDVDDAGAMRVTPAIGGGPVGAGPTTLYTVPPGIVVTALHTMTFANLDLAGARRLSLCLVQPGGGAGGPNQIFADLLEPGESVTIRAPFHLAPGGSVIALADIGGKIDSLITGLEYAQQPAGLILRVIEGVTIAGPGPLTTLYTCPAGVIEAIPLTLLIGNINATPRRLQIVTASATTFYDQLQPWESVLIEDPQRLAPGHGVHAVTFDGAVTGRLTILEVL